MGVLLLIPRERSSSQENPQATRQPVANKTYKATVFFVIWSIVQIFAQTRSRTDLMYLFFSSALFLFTSFSPSLPLPLPPLSPYFLYSPFLSRQAST
jgi:hypothetical protein